MKIKLLLLFLLMNTFAFSQVEIDRDVMASSGSVVSNSNLSISFTLGETFTSTFTESDIITQGFQQIDYNEKTELCNFIDAEISIFPNPSSGNITFVSCITEKFSYKIFEMTGKLVSTGTDEDGVLELDISGLANGKYIFEYILNSGQNQFISFLKTQ